MPELCAYTLSNHPRLIFSTMRTLLLRKLNQKISVIDLHLIAQITIILCSQTVIKSHQWGKYKLETQLKPFTFPQKLAPY